MVVKRSLNCGSNGFNVSNIPKAPRSTRRKVSSNESQICAFDLLASLAGKLLEESESSSTSTYGDNHAHLIKQEHQDDFHKPCKSQGSPVSKSASDNGSQTCLQVSSVENDCVLEQMQNSDCQKVCGLKPLVRCEVKKGDCDFLVEEKGQVTNGLKDPSLVHMDSDVQLPPCVDSVPDGSFEGFRKYSKLASRDDDENYRKYYRLSDKCKSYRPLTQVGNRKMNKSTTTKYGRAFSRSKCFEDARADGCLKALYRKRKSYYGYNPWKHDSVYRKRRLSDKGLVTNSDEGLSSESVTNSPEKGESDNGVFSAAIGLHSKDSRVKFSIKSFRIPELLVEVPKTATVGSLKRTVKEAVSALLGGGIHIGVLLQGKKVRDDNNTLSQTGLSCRENLGNLGFTLEPGPEKLPVPLSSEVPVASMPTDSTEFSERSPASPVLDSTIPCPLQDADHLIHSGDSVENNLEIVPYQGDISTNEQPSSDSRALIPVPALEPEALAIVPVNEKPKRTELSQRRTRRPFSVTEVEALVHAVEELGTGRWRDVKLRSFENASHRTYVDLKDKWKTLVHTASISPQQRRGEPVPQELLDRVLAAHRYWSQNQLKQTGKLQAAATMVVA